VRRAIIALLRSHTRQLLTNLDHTSDARAQTLTLTRLVRKAQNTRFGRDHDFRRIRDVADFRRLVPVCTPLDLWHTYWSTAAPNLKGVTWPGPATGLAAAGGSSRPVPITADMWPTHRAAAWTALAFALHCRPRARLFDGQFLFLGDPGVWGRLDSSLAQTPPGSSTWPELPPLLRPFAVGLETRAHRADADVQDEMVARSVALPVTTVVGEASRLLRFFAAVKHATGRDDVREVWPGLTAVVFTRKPTGPDRGLIAEQLATRSGDAPVLLLETVLRPEGALAVEDPRHGHLRLLAQHGLYHEFVPVAEMHGPRPTRHGLAEVEVGVPYAVAVTSPAGLWACLTGWTVCFERRDPPLLRVVSASLTRGPADRIDAGALPFAVQAPHPRNGAAAPLPTGTFHRKIS
jgi:hypothetical protein